MAAPAGEKRPIIKKVHKGHAAHGGSWKVAYADFVTAMMAFFLLMWLLGMASKEQKEGLSQYFQQFSLFEAGGKKFTVSPSSSTAVRITMEYPPMPTGINDDEVKEYVKQQSKALQEKLKKAVEEKLQALKDQIMVEVTEGGVRVEMVDKDNNPMFASGSAELNDKARSIIKLVSENIKEVKYKIAIEGHTDAAPFKSGTTSNWELSTARATATRRELEQQGVSPERIARVVGYADKELLFKENPKDPRNRRISIILMPPPPEPGQPGEKTPNAESPPAGTTEQMLLVPPTPHELGGPPKPIAIPPAPNSIDMAKPLHAPLGPVRK